MKNYGLSECKIWSIQLRCFSFRRFVKIKFSKVDLNLVIFENIFYEIQGYLLRDTLTGKFVIPDRDGQKAAFDDDKAKESKIASVQDAIQFQTDYVNELSELTKG